MGHTAPHMMIASNFDALLPIIFGIPVAFVGLGFVSFIPAFRGHWSAVLLAAPSVVIGAMLTWGIVNDSRPDQLIPALWIFFPAPLVVGVTSIILWAVRRRSRRSQA